MTMKVWSDERATDYDLNNNFNETIVNTVKYVGLAAIKSAYASAVGVDSQDGGVFVEAFNDDRGRNDYFVGGSAVSSGGGYAWSSVGTSSGSVFADDFNRADSATVGNSWTENETAAISNKVVTLSIAAGITHDIPSNPTTISFKVAVADSGQNPAFTFSVDDSGANLLFGARIAVDQIEYSDGAGGWTEGATAVNNEIFDITFKNIDWSAYTFDFVVNGIVRSTGNAFDSNASIDNVELLTANTTGIIYYFSCGTLNEATATVQLRIPTGLFSSVIANAVGVAHFVNIEDETGFSVDYEITNLEPETSGSLVADNTPEFSSFTAFTVEPDMVEITLTPKTTSPTTLYPNIRGFYLVSYP